MSSPHSLRLVVIAPDLAESDTDDDEARALIERSRQLRIGLLEGGFNLIATLPADTFLAERLAQLQPDMIIVDAESDARDCLEHVVMATRDARRPIVLFTNDDDTSHVKEAVAAGVSAYIVAGLEPLRVRPILDVAQHGMRLALRRQCCLCCVQQVASGQGVLGRCRNRTRATTCRGRVCPWQFRRALLQRWR